jgi:hypothetical protein
MPKFDVPDVRINLHLKGKRTFGNGVVSLPLFEKTRLRGLLR